jgi:hypothetical protein
VNATAGRSHAHNNPLHNDVDRARTGVLCEEN